MNVQFTPKTWSLFPKQELYVFSGARWTCFFGGFNNGKTTALCLRGIHHSLTYPGNRGVLIRRHADDLRRTTRSEFFRIFGCNEETIHSHPLVERWSQTENLLRFKNSSEVYFLHLDNEKDLQNIASLNARWFGMDQAEEIVEAAWLTMIGRVGRTDVDADTGRRLPPAWGSVVGNPSGHNWIWNYWKKDSDVKGWTGSDYYLVEASTYDNPLASEEYIRSLKERYPAIWYKRFVEGCWDVASGRVYDEFNVKYHVIDPFEVPDGWKAGIGVDLGYNHPTVFVWVAVDYEGNWIVYDEHVGREMIPSQHAEVVKRKGLKTKRGMLPVYGPHDAHNRLGDSGRNWQELYRECGIYMNVGNRMKPVVGIQRIKRMLYVDNLRENKYRGGLGSPRLYVFSTCVKLIEEFGLYSWKQLRPGEEEVKSEPDEVVKVNDDALDALRTWAMAWISKYVPVEDAPVPVDIVELESFPVGQYFDINKYIKRSIRELEEKEVEIGGY